MANLQVQEGVRSASFEATIIRADGTREPLGVIAYYHRNPLRRLAWRVSHLLTHPSHLWKA